jgi:hypothetical protein
MKRMRVASVEKLEKGMRAMVPPKSSRFELNEDPRRNGCSDAQRTDHGSEGVEGGGGEAKARCAFVAEYPPLASLAMIGWYPSQQ